MQEDCEVSKRILSHKEPQIIPLAPINPRSSAQGRGSRSSSNNRKRFSSYSQNQQLEQFYPIISQKATQRVFSMGGDIDLKDESKQERSIDILPEVRVVQEQLRVKESQKKDDKNSSKKNQGSLELNLDKSFYKEEALPQSPQKKQIFTNSENGSQIKIDRLLQGESIKREVGTEGTEGSVKFGNKKQKRLYGQNSNYYKTFCSVNKYKKLLCNSSNNNGQSFATADTSLNNNNKTSNQSNNTTESANISHQNNQAYYYVTCNNSSLNNNNNTFILNEEKEKWKKKKRQDLNLSEVIMSTPTYDNSYCHTYTLSKAFCFDSPEKSPIVAHTTKRKSSNDMKYPGESRYPSEIKYTSESMKRANSREMLSEIMPKVQMEVLEENSPQILSNFTNNSPDDDFTVILDSQFNQKIDKESLFIRLNILERENKEIKCHNLRFAEKYRELLEEYKRFKEYQDSIDRKSMYQKHVHRLAELSKQCFNLQQQLIQKDIIIKEKQEIIEQKISEINRLNEILSKHDKTKQHDIQQIQIQFNQQIQDSNTIVEKLKKENNKIDFLEISYKELLDKTSEEKKKLLAVLETTTDKFNILKGKHSDMEDEMSKLKSRIREQENIIIKIQSESNAQRNQLIKSHQEQMLKLQMQFDKEKFNWNEKEQKYGDIIIELNNSINDLNDQIQKEEIRTSCKLEDMNARMRLAASQFEKHKEEQENTINSLNMTIKKLTNELNEQTDQNENLLKQLRIQQKENVQLMEKHEEEINTIFKEKSNETNSLNFKLKEMKLQYEIQMENIEKEARERIILSAQDANDAQRIVQALKNQLNSELEAKDQQLNFLKSRMFEEKQKLKEEIQEAYKESVRELLKKVDFLTASLETQYKEIEDTICTDLSLMGKSSRFWKRSKEMREANQMSMNTDDYKKIYGGNKGKKQLSQTNAQKIKFQTIAKCAAAFQKEQEKVESLRSQIEVLSKKISTLLKKQLISKNVRVPKQDLKNDQANLIKEAGKIQEGVEQDTLDMELEDGEYEGLALAKKVAELMEQLRKVKADNKEREEKYMRENNEYKERYELENISLKKQLESLNSVKIQSLFAKDIIIEKQASKLAEFGTVIQDQEKTIGSNKCFIENIQTEFQDITQKHSIIVEQYQKEKQELILLYENRPPRDQDILLINQIKQERDRLNSQLMTLHSLKSEEIALINGQNEEEISQIKNAYTQLESDIQFYKTQLHKIQPTGNWLVKTHSNISQKKAQKVLVQENVLNVGPKESNELKQSAILVSGKSEVSNSDQKSKIESISLKKSSKLMSEKLEIKQSSSFRIDQNN